MRRFAVFAALFGMVAAPMAPVGAEETADIYSKDGVQGPSFARATQCAAMFATSLEATQEGSDDYNFSLKIATGWLNWAKRIADNRDAESALSDKVDAFKQSVSGLSPEGASGELSKQLVACQTVAKTMGGMEPFTTIYNEAVTGRPGFNTAVDCATTYSVIAQAIGEKDDNYDWYNDGVETWTEYAVDQTTGTDNEKIAAIQARALVVSDKYTKLLTDDQQAGLDRLSADRDACKGREPDLPKYFKNR
jgi:hypothetical protein